MTSAFRKWSFDIITVVILTIAVLFPVTVYVVGASHACNGENTVRTQFVSFVDSSVSRAVLATNATLASATASAQQKAVASRNLTALKAVQADAHRQVKLSDCSLFGGL